MLKEATETHSRKPRPWGMLGTEDPVLWVCWFVFNTTGVRGVVTCFWLCCVLVVALALLELQCVGAPPRCSTQAPHRTWLLGCSTGSGCAGLSSCGSWALERRLMDLVGLRHVASSCTRDQTCVFYTGGGFFTTEPPGKPQCSLCLFTRFQVIPIHAKVWEPLLWIRELRS